MRRPDREIWFGASRRQWPQRHYGNMVWNGEQQHRSSSASIFALHAEQPVT
jgi:hypothetical protein